MIVIDVDGSVEEGRGIFYQREAKVIPTQSGGRSGPLSLWPDWSFTQGRLALTHQVRRVRTENFATPDSPDPPTTKISQALLSLSAERAAHHPNLPKNYHLDNLQY